MTDTAKTLTDQELAEKVRSAASALAAAWNAAADAGLTVDARFIEHRSVGKALPNVVADVTVRRVTTEDL